MSATPPVTRLAERKRLLVLQADMHRTLLCAVCVDARARLSWLNEVRRKARSAWPWLASGATAMGLLAAGQWRKPAKWISVALAAWRAWRKLKSD